MTEEQRLKIAVECLHGVRETDARWRTTREGRLHVVVLTDQDWPRREWGYKAHDVTLALSGMMIAAAQRLARIGRVQ